MPPSIALAIRTADAFALQRMIVYARTIGEDSIAALLCRELTRRGLSIDVTA